MEGKVWPLPYQKQLKQKPKAYAASSCSITINALKNRNNY
jgi:hypothetical protein